MRFQSIVAIALLILKSVGCFRWQSPVDVTFASPVRRVCVSPSSNYHMRSDFYLEAHKTGTGCTRNGRDSNPKFLGIKKSHNSFAFIGNIILRQRGAKFKSGIGTKMGRDHTIYAVKNGRVQILNHRVSVLDLAAEREMLRQQRASNYYMQPTLHTLCKLWTGNAEKVNK